MAGNKEGGLKAAAKNTANDPDFYRRIGRIGGRNGHGGGFAANRELASRAGAIGGKISKRGKSPAKAATRRETAVKAVKELIRHRDWPTLGEISEIIEKAFEDDNL